MSSTAAITLINIPGPTVTAASTNENCGHANGTASSIPNGGTQPYSYLWSNSETNQNITNLPAQTYTLTLTDANSCTVATSFVITNIAGPSLLVTSSVEETCSYGNGSATVNAINGAPPYSYSWSNSTTTATASNLHAGTYICIVTDSNNCTADNTITITNTPAPTLTITEIDSASCGFSDGSATLNVNVGSPPYAFIWNSSPQQTNQNLLNVPTGVYIVTVTDAIGCTNSTSVNVSHKKGLTATVISKNEACNKGNGAATVNVTGGSGTYTTYGVTGKSLKLTVTLHREII